MAFNKYGAKKTVCRHEHKHDSKREAARCDELHLLQQGGEISNLEIHRRFPLFAYGGEKVAEYEADFCYYDEKILSGPNFIVEDVKGVKTAVYQLKKRLMKACHSIDILETK